MMKQDEIDYIKTVVEKDKMDSNTFLEYLYSKPYSDNQCWLYLVDMGQTLKFLPPKPARVLDLGVGSGWTSEILAKCGYSVVGIDINPDMIALSQRRLNSLPSASIDLKFHVADFEKPIPFGPFDAAVSYDSLHHAENEMLLIQRVFDVLKPSAVFVMIEPGKGHSLAEYSIQAMKKYGTTEKDMPFEHVEPLLKKAGFKSVSQYLRIGLLDCVDISSKSAYPQQETFFKGLCWNTTKLGLSSIIVARKG